MTWLDCYIFAQWLKWVWTFLEIVGDRFEACSSFTDSQRNAVIWEKKCLQKKTSTFFAIPGFTVTFLSFFFCGVVSCCKELVEGLHVFLRLQIPTLNIGKSWYCSLYILYYYRTPSYCTVLCKIDCNLRICINVLYVDVRRALCWTGAYVNTWLSSPIMTARAPIRGP